MANFDRDTIPGSYWSSDELLAYNITIVEKDEQAFFSAPLPEYTGPAGFIQHADWHSSIEGLDKASTALLKRLHYATKIAEGQETIIDDFFIKVLGVLGYESETRVVRLRRKVFLNICGEQVCMEADVCIQDRDPKICLLAQQDKSRGHSVDPEAQLVAEAIAAFQTTNSNRYKKIFPPPLRSYVFPGMTMVGTFPRFYKIKVTHDLDQAVQAGQHPAMKTVVERHTPCVPGRRDEGMMPLDNRVKILRCFEAFKQFLYPQESEHICFSFLPSLT